MRKKLLALLLAAALALGLLAGCGGGKSQSLSQMLLNLLDGQYQNVSVEIDSDLESKLRQAISESETDEELRAALEQLLGGGISFQRLGSGQQGDTAWTLIIYPGTDPDAAARSVYLDLDKVFAALPADGVYSSGFAMAEMENGYAILVRATVDKAGTEDKPDPVTLESIKVTKEPDREYWAGQPFNPDGMEITATYSNGTTKTLKDIKQNGDQGVKWTPDGALTTVGTQDITITYGEKTTTVSVTVKEPTLKSITVRGYQDTYNAGDSFTPTGTGMEVTVTYSDDTPVTITGIKTNGEKGVSWEPADGLAAGTNSVTIIYTDDKGQTISTKVPVTVDNVVEGTGYKFNKTANKATITGKSGLENLFKEHKTEAANAVITLKELGSGETYTVTEQLTDTFSGTLTSEGGKAKIELSGGASLFGTIASGAEVSNLDITVTNSISVTVEGGSNAHAGAVAAKNSGIISGCKVTINSNKSIQAHSNGSGSGGSAHAGGIVGENETGGHISGCEVIVNGTISAEKSDGNSAYAGGIAGYNQGTIDGNCTVKVAGTIKATGSGGAGANAGGIAGYIDDATSITNCSVTLENGTIQAITTTTDEYLGSAYAGGMVGTMVVYDVLRCGPATGSGSITAQATNQNNYTYSATVTPGSDKPTDSEGNRAYAGTTCGLDAFYDS